MKQIPCDEHCYYVKFEKVLNLFYKQVFIGQVGYTGKIKNHRVHLIRQWPGDDWLPCMMLSRKDARLQLIQLFEETRNENT